MELHGVKVPAGIAAAALAAGLTLAPQAAFAEDKAQGAAQTTEAAQEQEAGKTAESSGTASGTDAAGSKDDSSAEIQAASPIAAATSSDTSTYEEAGLYQVQIRYVDADTGEAIASTYSEAYQEGAAFSVASPTLSGYELADASQAAIAGTASGTEHNLVYTVSYRKTEATYTVLTELQVGDDYRVAKSETRMAPIGTTATVVAPAIDGYHLHEGSGTYTTEVTADGKATVEIKYDQDVKSYAVYFQTDGDTYIPAQSGQVGDAVAVPADPTRRGYAFAGWDTDGDGVADALPTTIPDHDVTAVAVWTPVQTKYTIKYWGELEGKHGQYGIIAIDESHTALTESTLTDPAPKLDTSKGSKYQYYTYAKEDQNVTIAGDGTSVLNVYYDWKPVHVTFYVLLDGKNSSQLSQCPVLAEFDEKMFDEVESPSAADAYALYKENGGKLKRFNVWNLTETGLQWSGSDIDRVLDSQIVGWSGNELVGVAYASFTDQEIKRDYFERYMETADGGSFVNADFSCDEDPSDVAYVDWSISRYRGPFEAVAYRHSSCVWDGEDRSTIQWDDWTPFDPATVNSRGVYAVPREWLNKTNFLQVMYKRLVYDARFHDGAGTTVKTESARYGADVALPTAEELGLEAPNEGMVFAGWVDKDGNAVSSSLTMPEGGLDLYATWKYPDVHVTFESNGGTEVAGQTLAHGSKATDPVTTRAGFTFGGWYFFGANSTTPARFSFDQPIDEDITLYAAWRQDADAKAGYTVVHRAADGTVLATEQGEGLVGDTVTALPLDASARQGWTYASAAGITKTLAEDADQNVFEFLYTKDPVRTYTVRYVDAATGESLAADNVVDTIDALEDASAPEIDGYQVRNGGEGWLAAGSEGAATLTFYYDRTQQPAPAGGDSDSAEAGQASCGPKHMRAVSDTPAEASPASVPDTGDPSAAAPIAGLAGLGMASLGAILRRRRQR